MSETGGEEAVGRCEHGKYADYDATVTGRDYASTKTRQVDGGESCVKRDGARGGI